MPNASDPAPPTDTAASDEPDLAATIVALGREGLSRREIAARLGYALGRLETLGEDDPDLWAALQQADDAARAWWESLPRRALAAGARFNLGGWRAAMSTFYGDQPAKPAVPLARYEIPPNGRERRRPQR